MIDKPLSNFALKFNLRRYNTFFINKLCRTAGAYTCPLLSPP